MEPEVVELPEVAGIFTDEELQALILAAMPDPDDEAGVTEEELQTFVDWAVLQRVSEMLIQLAIDGELRIDVRGNDPNAYGWYKPEEKENE